MRFPTQTQPPRGRFTACAATSATSSGKKNNGWRPSSKGSGAPASNSARSIPIRKADAWWDLSQDERRAVFEARSRHIAIGAHYLPAVARRLYHARDLGEPFDFLTWFEFGDATPARSTSCSAACARPKSGNTWFARSKFASDADAALRSVARHRNRRSRAA